MASFPNSPLNAEDLDHQVPLIRLTEGAPDSLASDYIEYTTCLPDYPKTSTHGYSYIVEKKDSLNGKDGIKTILDEVQYSKDEISRKNIYCAFLRAPVLKVRLKCSGVKICEYLSSDLKSITHTSYNNSIWSQMRQAQQAVDLTEPDQNRRNTYTFYHSVLSRFERQKGCLQQLDTCSPGVQYHREPDVNGELIPFVGCVHYLNNPRYHFYRRLLGTQLNVELLKGLFDNNINPMPEECSMILHQKTRRLKCGINHPQGSGALLKLGCEVYFYLLLPIDQKTCPYYIFLSQGVHQHPPPPLTKTPARIIQCLEKIIFNTLTPDMTTSTFLKSPALQQFCHDNNAFTLADVHQSLNNTDRVTAIIQRQKLLHFPEGQHYNGVAFEMQINPQIKEYIQAKYQDDSEFMLICALKEQLELLLTLKSFEVDMSYKRLKAAKLNEVVFTTYLPNHGKIITLVRVFTNQESPIGYYRLFKRVFQVIANVTGQSVCFWHIHQEGFQGIICDMDNKQTSGLGKYLYELDPSRTTEEHLRSTIVFCQVHFHRNIVKAVGNHPNQQGVRQRMAGLLTCKCMDDYYKLLDLLQAHETDNADNVFHWAQHKRDPVIAAGLNKHCSLIPSEHWDFIRNSTNTAEQTHNKSYAFGRQQLLLPAVKSAWILDKRDIQQYLGRETFSIFHANRTTNMETHYLRHMQRDFSRKRQHSFSSPTMDDDNIQLPSTSGIIPPSLRNEQSSPSVRQSSIRERSWSRQSSSRGRTPTRSSSSALRRVASANIEVQQAQLDIEKEKVEIERERLKLEQERVKLAREQAEVRQLELQNLERERELYKK